MFPDVVSCADPVRRFARKHSRSPASRLLLGSGNWRNHRWGRTAVGLREGQRQQLGAGLIGEEAQRDDAALVTVLIQHEGGLPAVSAARCAILAAGADN